MTNTRSEDILKWLRKINIRRQKFHKQLCAFLLSYIKLYIIAKIPNHCHIIHRSKFYFKKFLFFYDKSSVVHKDVRGIIRNNNTVLHKGKKILRGSHKDTL